MAIPPIDSLRSTPTVASAVRFECLAFIVGTRLALSSAICGQLAADKEDDDLTGSMALMLLVNSLLTNATGDWKRCSLPAPSIP